MSAHISNVRPRPDKVLELISSYAKDFEIKSQDAYATARYCLVDTLGCAFGGQGCEAARIALAIAEGAIPARGAGRVLGSHIRATAEEAAFINTTLMLNHEPPEGANGNAKKLSWGIADWKSPAGRDGRVGCATGPFFPGP